MKVIQYQKLTVKNNLKFIKRCAGNPFDYQVSNYEKIIFISINASLSNARIF